MHTLLITMEFEECLFGRRSIRNFTDQEISDEVIKKIINAGIYAPSACNFEAWKFIVVKEDTKNKEHLKNYIALKTRYGILVVYRNDLYVSGRVYNDYYQSASAAIQNMLLYIHSIGLGGVWICGLPKPKEIKKAFNIPKNFDVIGYIAFGYPDKGNENSSDAISYHYGDEVSFKEHKRRFNIDQVMCNDTFYTVDGDCTYATYPKKEKIIVKIKKLLKKIGRKIFSRKVETHG